MNITLVTIVHHHVIAYVVCVTISTGNVRKDSVVEDGRERTVVLVSWHIRVHWCL